MIKTYGLKTKFSPITKLGENYYKICWDYKELKDNDASAELDSNIAEWISETLTFTPTLDYIKNIILDYYNKKIDKNILSGFIWRDMPIWLSKENQFNYKAAYDLAVLTEGLSLPVTFKFGTTLNPIYYTFSTIGDFTDFYVKATTHINTCLSDGWKIKDSIDWSLYNIN